MYEGMTTTEIFRHEKDKRHAVLMAEAKAEFDAWDTARQVAREGKKAKWFRAGLGSNIGFPIHFPKTAEV